ncbi:S8 family serine peptidase [Hamadaea sp. NPDC051192]|uniref:S8 family serine peptidase n=1 Tax=Hamadaea sp. NPDC051192 TaxID=3154940 RepID=UPI003447F490
MTWPIQSLRTCAISIVALIIALSCADPAEADDLKDGQWYVSFLGLNDAHKVTTGAGVAVALIDTGVDSVHPDLNGSVVGGADFSSGGQVSTGDGRRDANGHGTQMAGLIVGSGKITGVAPGATIIPINDSFSSVGGSSSNLAEGIRWAVDHDVRVISISSAGPDHPLLKQMIELALANDIVVVAGAGNVPRDTTVAFPAAYPGVIAACGVDRRGNHSSISTTGPELVLCAPSDGISSSYPGNKYAVGSGTSESTALIAGAAALVRAKFPTLSAAEVVHRLTATASDKGAPGRDSVYGFGVLNVVDALTRDVREVPSSRTGSKATPSASTDAPAGVLKPWHIALGGGVCLFALAAAGVAAGLVVRRARR